jgi:hypothetical protein
VVVLKAKVIDSTHLELLKPIAAGRGRTILVAVDESGDANAEHEGWLELSAASLERAYGEDEPDYTAVALKETNPEFRP